MTHLMPDHLESVVPTIEEQGYAIVENIIPPGLLDNLVTRIEELLLQVTDTKEREGDFKGSATHSIRNLLNRGEVFQEAASFGPILSMAERLLGPGPLVFASAVVKVGPGEVPQRLHSDDILIDLPRPLPAPLIMNSIWALSDFTATNGATRLVPGSHKLDHVPLRGKTYETIPALMKRGSVLFYHGSMWHGADRNTTASVSRLGMTISYCARFIRPYENQLKLFGLEKARTLSPEMRRLIGYDYWIPPDMKR
jgi:ectoine hydroxylase-related dioxygenase (phytanoyl-CoA dioxygenase family)